MLVGNISRVARLRPLIPNIFSRLYSKLDVDVIDDFTSQLMQKKISKWDQQKRQNEASTDNAIRVVDNTTDLIAAQILKPDQIGFLFQEAFDNDDTIRTLELMNVCIERDILPPFSILFNALSVCSQAGDKRLLYRIRDLCQIYQPDLLKENSDFKHFVAEAIWVRGDVVKAVSLFEEVYCENAYLRRRIRLMLKQLIANVVSNKGEGALRAIITFSERLMKDFQDFSPLTCVWQACFLSEWFTDQQIALELLERNNGLCKSVINRIPYVVYMSLKCHRTEVIYRLLEVLLEYKMKQQCANVVASLLDYQFRSGDLHSCSEIIKWAINSEIPLPYNQHIKFINLLLSKKMQTPLAPLQQKLQNQPSYNLKF